MHLSSALAICIFIPVMRAACARAFERGLLVFSEKQTIVKWNAYLAVQRVSKCQASPVSDGRADGDGKSLVGRQPGRACTRVGHISLSTIGGLTLIRC
jgi:UPF0716 family protein affecting phage T7 exclusion